MGGPFNADICFYLLFETTREIKQACKCDLKNNVYTNVRGRFWLSMKPKTLSYFSPILPSSVILVQAVYIVQ